MVVSAGKQGRKKQQRFRQLQESQRVDTNGASTLRDANARVHRDAGINRNSKSGNLRIFGATRCSQSITTKGVEERSIYIAALALSKCSPQ